jgi:glycosyltransferase involved in cell wall biosynthesis
VTGPVLLDIQAIQSVGHPERGIARYVREVSTALLDARPDLIGGLVVNPDLPGLAPTDDLARAGLVVSSDRVVPGPGVYHVLSPYEPDLAIDRIFPAGAAARQLIVTVYDLIPEVFAGEYLPHAGPRRRYRARHHLVRAADRVLAISDATAREVIERVHVDERRVVMVGAGVSPHFVPPVSRADAARAARAALPALDERFVLYTGGSDARKNPTGLLDAYSRVPDGVRRRWQLVMVWRMSDDEQRALAAHAADLEIADRVLFTGFVPDDTLALLYQATDLFVFPSRYEGFGLPVAEALACGAPAIAGATSSLVELLPPAALFDPLDPGAIARAIERALTDDHLRAALVARAREPAPTWQEVATRTAAVYDELLTRPPRPPVSDLVAPRRAGHAAALRIPWRVPG